jgi:hypothetical protein
MPARAATIAARDGGVGRHRRRFPNRAARQDPMHQFAGTKAHHADGLSNGGTLCIVRRTRGDAPIQWPVSHQRASAYTCPHPREALACLATRRTLPQDARPLRAKQNPMHLKAIALPPIRRLGGPSDLSPPLSPRQPKPHAPGAPASGMRATPHVKRSQRAQGPRTMQEQRQNPMHQMPAYQPARLPAPHRRPARHKAGRRAPRETRTPCTKSAADHRRTCPALALAEPCA